tara:strand:- start:4183 stop:5181 length:999 start_codon:yes stop_codon:yes gene_type:complete
MDNFKSYIKSIFTNNYFKLAILLFITVLILILSIVVVNNNYKSKQKFSNLNSTIKPEYVYNNKKIKDLSSCIKRNNFRSSDGFSSNVYDDDNDCAILKNKIHSYSIPESIKEAENKPEKYLYSFDDENTATNSSISVNSDMNEITSDRTMNRENFYSYKNKSANEYSNKNFINCSRPEFIRETMNKDLIGRWTYQNNPDCKSMEMNNKDSWSLKNINNEDDSVIIKEGFLGDRTINDSKVVPARTLPEYSIMNSKPLKTSKDFIKEDYENRNNIIYNMTDTSETAWNDETFNQKTKCCHKNNTTLKYIQDLDEYNYDDNMKLLESVTGMDLD